jgi:hypothetical protein
MSAVPYQSHEQDWDAPDQEPFAPPGRPRRRFFNRKSAALVALLTCAVGFYAGIRVEKGQLPSTASAASASAPGAVAGAQTGAPAGGAPTGSGAPGGLAGAGRFGGGAGGSASLGTLSSVSGNTIYLTDTTGNTVKVTLSSSTKLTKSLSVSKSSLHPGDSVVVQGVKNSKGTIVATSVSDSGARTPANGSSSASTGSGNTGSGSSAGNTANGG